MSFHAVGADHLARNYIYRLNCLDGMPMMRARSVDLILSDPPYGITENGWDSLVDLTQLGAGYKRLIRQGGVILLTAQCPFDKHLGVSNRKWLRYRIDPGEVEGYRISSRAAQPSQGPRKRPFARRSRSTTRSSHPASRTAPGCGGRSIPHLGRHIGGAITENYGFRYLRTVLRVSSEGHGIHPTQKPVALFEYLIRTYTDPGDLVLDTFIGSGTTAFACIKTNRNFIGFERDPDFFQLAEKRIRSHRQRKTEPYDVILRTTLCLRLESCGCQTRAPDKPELAEVGVSGNRRTPNWQPDGHTANQTGGTHGNLGPDRHWEEFPASLYGIAGHCFGPRLSVFRFAW